MYQVGGMGVVVLITIAPRIVVTRYVSKILLRWYLTQLQNKINTVTIISAHIPYELSSSGIRTMYKHTIYVWYYTQYSIEKYKTKEYLLTRRE